VVQLDDLGGLEEPRRLGRERHGEHGGQAEVRRDQHPEPAFRAVRVQPRRVLGDAATRGVVPPGGAHDGVRAGVQHGVHVGLGRRRHGEIDGHVGARQVRGVHGVARVEARDELQVGRRVDGGTGLGAHTAGGSEDGDLQGLGHGRVS
jgi:hypothetical protein